jgi:hypothetical protein
MFVFIKRVVSKRFEWCWKREKVSCKKVVKKGAYLDCGFAAKGDSCPPRGTRTMHVEICVDSRYPVDD